MPGNGLKSAWRLASLTPGGSKQVALHTLWSALGAFAPSLHLSCFPPTPTPYAPSACSPVSCSQLLLCPSQRLTMAFLETLPPYPASGFPCLLTSRLIPRGLLPPYPSFSPKRRSVCNGSRRPPCVGLNQFASVIRTTECLPSNPISGALLKNCLTSVSTSVKWRFRLVML